jgi:CsoR family transcriptional regulator, copper-sensing transcriptional repressor
MGVSLWSDNMHNKEMINQRLRSIEGHIRGVEKMVDEDVYCIEVLHQIQAIQAALNKVSVNILDNHLKSCVTTAIRGEDPLERERVLKEITDVFEAATKS